MITLVVLGACKHEKTENEIIVDKLLTYSFEMPPSPELGFLPLYIRKSDTDIYIITTYDLKQLYENINSEKIEFSDFLLQSFNQNIFLPDTCSLLETFKIDTTIFNEYLQNGFEIIIERYTTQTDDGYVLKSSIIDFEKQSTVSYIFFLNNYFSIFDDLYGETTYLTFRECLNMPPDSN